MHPETTDEDIYHRATGRPAWRAYPVQGAGRHRLRRRLFLRGQTRSIPGFGRGCRTHPYPAFGDCHRHRLRPQPWLESNDALPLATRMETRHPWRPTRGSLTSPSYLERNSTRGPPLENNPEIPPSSRDEGLRLLHGLDTNLATSLQTPQEA